MKKAILLVAYGASNTESRESLRGFEIHCRNRFPGISIRWAYTSVSIREYIAAKKQKSDSVNKALLRLYFEKFQKITIQPLQTICGHEHECLTIAVKQVMEETDLICNIGKPLLYDSCAVAPVAQALLAHLPSERHKDEDVVFMGHGARHPAVTQYERLGKTLFQMDAHIHLGTMNGATLLNDILPRLTTRSVWLLPLLSIIGKHALRDMAGEAPNSWKSQIENKGHICKTVLKGMAESPRISSIWLDNLEEAFNST